jgi:hypothetical protein
MQRKNVVYVGKLIIIRYKFSVNWGLNDFASKMEQQKLVVIERSLVVRMKLEKAIAIPLNRDF